MHWREREQRLHSLHAHWNANPDLTALLGAGDGDAALAWARQAGEGAPSVGSALRRERLAYATTLAIGDLAGAFPVAQVMAELSELADRALDSAIGAAIRKRVDNAEPQGMIALALGKHGAGELNYSSDIDPILLYDPETLPRRERDEPGEAAQRYAREVVKLLSENTDEGYVFRVDLRLRPGLRSQPAGDFLQRGSYALSRARHWRGSVPHLSALAPRRVILRRAKVSLRRSGPSSGEAASTTERSRKIRRLTKRIRANYKGPG